jgi:ATP phosphoribosyltransferase regulatory subunit
VAFLWEFHMPLWRLPDNLSDVLPTEARQIESLRHTALDVLRTWGYEMVTPPLLEGLAALTTGTAQDLEAVMFKVVDPVTGGLLGIRADVTPQAARIDAHLLNRTGPTRLCYCATALRSQVSDAFVQRELLQLGAELFGHAGIEADLEIQELTLHVLYKLGLGVKPDERLILALSHSGVLTAVFAQYPILKAHKTALLMALRTKDQTALIALCANLSAQHVDFDSPLPLLTLLIGSYGAPVDVPASRFAQWPGIMQAVAALHTLAAQAELSESHVEVVLDLTDLSGYDYHTGVQFSVYLQGLNTSIVRGGRYDAVGELFGRARAATGFSLDLRTVASLLPARSPMPAILAPWIQDRALDQTIAVLRQQGQVVIRSLPGHEHEQDEFLCDRVLTAAQTTGVWQLTSL